MHSNSTQIKSFVFVSNGESHLNSQVLFKTKGTKKLAKYLLPKSPSPLQLRKSYCWWKFVYRRNFEDMKLLSLVLIFLTIHCAHCADDKKENVKTSLDEQWRKYKVNAN